MESSRCCLTAFSTTRLSRMTTTASASRHASSSARRIHESSSQFAKRTINQQKNITLWLRLRLRSRNLISFDNSFKSYALRLDSFAFNITALAEQSLFHLISPGVTLYSKGDRSEE